MSDIVKNAWIGLLSGLAMLAMVNVNAANLTIEAPSGTATGKALVFSDTPKVGAEAATVMDVKLTASGTVTFDAIGIESPNFTLLPPATPPVGDCGATLADATSCTLHVKFTPEAAGKRYAELTIRSDALNGPHTVFLQGTAIGKANQTLTFGAAPSIAVGGTGAVSATSSAGLTPVTFSSNTTSVCTVSGSTVTGVTAGGTCTIAADQAGNADTNAATQTQSFSVGIGNQTISITAAPTGLAMGATGTVTATATSGLAVTLTSANTGVCIISGGTVTPVTTGTCTINANQAGNSNYTAAPQMQSTFTITAAKANQTIAFGTAPTVTAGATGTVSATASPSGYTVAFSSTTTGVCTVSGTTVTGVTAGTCTIAANQAGDASYNAAPTVNQSFTVGAAAGGGGDLCTQYGLTENTELTRAGNTSKTLPIRSTQGYSFSFTTGATGTTGQLRDNYSSVVQYVTVSKNKCDYAATLEPLCAKQGGTPLIYYKVGGTSTYQCILEPYTTYYYNVRDASRDATTKAFTNTCSGSCTFMTF